MALRGDECDKLQIKGVMVYIPLNLATGEGLSLGGNVREKKGKEREQE